MWCKGSAVARPQSLLLPYGLYGNFEMDFYGGWILPKDANPYSLANIKTVAMDVYRMYTLTQQARNLNPKASHLY